MKILENEKGFSLVELLAVLVILALLALLAGGTVINIIQKTNTKAYESREKAILNAAEKWAVDNSETFDDKKGETIQVGLDIVFVVDVSGSMDYSLVQGLGSSGCYDTKCKDKINYKTTRYYAAVEAINGALEVLRNNPKSRISFVFYSDSIKGNFPLRSAQSVGDLSVTTAHKINVLGTSVSVTGGTYTQGGLVKATEILASASNKENQIPVIILLTDGEPTYGYGGSDLKKNPAYSSNPAKYMGKDIGTGSAFSNAIGWHLINNASLAVAAVNDAYKVKPFVYTIALGLDEDYNMFVLDPSEDKFVNLKRGSSTGQSLYNAISSKMYIDGTYQEKYDYVTKSFYGKMDSSDLNQYFREIAKQVTNATDVSIVCVSVQELYDQGYLSKIDFEYAEGKNAKDQYVKISYLGALEGDEIEDESEKQKLIYKYSVVEKCDEKNE